MSYASSVWMMANSGRRTRTLPPQDSLITIQPEQGVTLDPRSHKEWHDKTRVLREVRGNILSSCFAVEFAVDRVISEIFFPGTDTPETPENLQETKNLFDDLFLKGHRANFASKIDLLKALRKKSDRLGGILTIQLTNSLDQLREVRNRFAHYPISFFPEQAADGQILVPKLVCRDKDLPLDDVFFEMLNKTFRFVDRSRNTACRASRIDVR